MLTFTRLSPEFEFCRPRFSGAGAKIAGGPAVPLLPPLVPLLVLPPLELAETLPALPLPGLGVNATPFEVPILLLRGGEGTEVAPRGGYDAVLAAELLLLL